MGALKAQPANYYNTQAPCHIKFIFRGMKSDDFINEIKDSINLEGVSLSITDKDNNEVESISSLGTVAHAKVDEYEGFVYDLLKTYKKGAYSFKVTYKENSLFFLKSYGCMSKSSDVSYQDLKDDTKQLYSRHFEKDNIYKVDGENTLYLIVEIGLNLTIQGTMQGASEKHIHQKSIKDSLLVPQLKNISMDYAANKALYSNVIQRRNKKLFDTFLSKEDGSISFKAVNYRKDIYTGDDNHCLDGDETFKTGIEEDFFHAEYIENRVFVIVECEGKRYLLDENNILVKQDNLIKTLKDINVYKVKKDYMYKKPENKDDPMRNKNSQYIYLHLVFDGVTLNHKEVLIEQIAFNEKGRNI